MKKLIRSFLAEVEPLWLKQRQSKGKARTAERPAQIEEIIRANPWVPSKKQNPGAQMRRETQEAATRH